MGRDNNIVSPKTPRLVLIKAGAPQEINLGQELTIGRAYSNLLRLDSEDVSRIHGIIYRRGASYLLRDLDSKNGIILNGLRATNAVLSAGDHIQIAGFSLVFDPPSNYDFEAFAGSGKETSPTRKDEKSAVHDSTSRIEAVVVPPTEEPNQTATVLSMAEIQAQIRKFEEESSQHFTGKVVGFHLKFFRATPRYASDLRAALQAILQALVEITGCDRGVIVLRDEVTDGLQPGAIVPQESDVAVNRVVLQAAIKDSSALLCNDVQESPLFRSTETVRKEHIGSLLSVPLQDSEAGNGLIYLDTINRNDNFSFEDIHVAFLAGNLVTAFVNACESYNTTSSGGPD